MNKLIPLFLSAILLAGCGLSEVDGVKIESESEVMDTNSDDVELVDPVVGTPSYYEAEYRTLYDVQVLSAILNPEVYEYTYETPQPFGSYGKVPGDTIQSGDIRIYGNTEAIDDKIEDLKEEIADNEKAYSEQSTDLKQDLAEAKKSESEKGTLRNTFDENVPMPIAADADRAHLQSRKIEEQIYELDSNHNAATEHYNNLLSIYEDSRRDVVVSSDRDGVLVGVGFYGVGDFIQQGTRVAAVADVNGIKKFETEFVDKGTLNKAQDIYALVNGKRYEVTPIVMDGKEYQQKKKLNGSVYTTFVVEDADELELGTYGIIVIEKDVRQDVLCVPTDAVTTENLVHYVNLYEDGITTKTEVKTGMKDGLYTEIISGLEAGDKVLSDNAVANSKSTRKLEKGSMSTDFSETGYLYCPTMEWFKNPVENGKCYLKELCVEDFEQVTPGQVLARIEVKTDSVKVERLKRQIQRQEERLADLRAEEAKDYSGKINYARNRQIRSYLNTIADLNEELAKINKYSGIVEITAPYTGMVVNTTDMKAGDLISSKQYLVELCDYSRCFIILQDKDGRLGYGNNVSVTFNSGDGTKQTLPGVVVTANRSALSSALASDEVLVALNQEDITRLIESGSGKGSSGWYRTRFSVETQVRSVDNVVLVPKNMVEEHTGSTYVKVKTENGTKLVSFVAGGSNLTNYWVVAGLEEGMEICSD